MPAGTGIRKFLVNYFTTVENKGNELETPTLSNCQKSSRLGKVSAVSKTQNPSMETENVHRPRCRLACLLIEFLQGSITDRDHGHKLHQDLHLLTPLILDETPLQKASREGRVEDLTKLLNEKDGILMELTNERESPLHLAVQAGHLEVVRALLSHATPKTYCRQFINERNFCGETVLHFATFRKDVQVLKLLLEDSIFAGTVDVNAKTDDGCTALDILDYLSETGEVEEEIEKVLRRAGGVRGNATKVLKDGSNKEVLIEVDEKFRGRPLHSKVHRTRPSVGGAHVALLLATMFATMTFHAALRIDSLSERAMDNQLSLENTIIERRIEVVMLTHVFVLLNSMAFFSSIGLIMILLHHLPLMPWLLLLVTSFSGAYIFAVMATTLAHEATTVSLLGASVLTAAIVNGMAFKFNKVALNYLRWICRRHPVVGCAERLLTALCRKYPNSFSQTNTVVNSIN